MTSAATKPTRVINGIEVPATGTWKVDSGHAEVGFAGKHFMLTTVRGRFTDVDITLEVGEEPKDTTVQAVINMASVYSGDAARDDHLRSADHFDVDQYETAIFVSKRLGWDGGRSGTLVGDLTIKGITREVALDWTYEGFAHDPWGNDRAVFSARGNIDRSDFGLTWNMVLDAGGLLVSKQIDLIFDFEAIRVA